ncbi:hypothetical protein QCA50_002814 [Cerrena zonata]|uniref:Uncharacterized protein n=1 Tax=Cerrena zonata TaxID=2478898 RepID=A0AAW0GIT0_9APHY
MSSRSTDFIRHTISNTPQHTMSDSSSLFCLAHNKLQSAVGGHGHHAKDASLHRWVLLKNVIIRSHIAAPEPSSPSDTAGADSVNRPEERRDEVEQDSFMFPDPDALLANAEDDEDDCMGEDQWLDALLEDLGDSDDEDMDDGLSLPNTPNHEEDEPLSPLYSPMSSSDDLVEQSNYYYPPQIAIPYPIPYPPLHPPLIPSWLNFDHSNEEDSILTPSPPLYHDPLPYSSQDDDIEDLPVPDAIEDTSDDESDAPSTPATTSTSSLTPSTSLPSPRERTRLHSHPHVYIGTDDSYFYPFELDPLPFSDNERRVHHPSHPPFQCRLFMEC